uniref:Uncharacterized protein n=1 Tax=Anopheles funestus TaxID=62324 RepID=A0A182RN45_ANOFN
MEEYPVWNNFADMFDTSNLSEWLKSVDVQSFVVFACGVLIMSLALRIMSLLFWPTVVVIGLLFFRNETFATLITDRVKQISHAVLNEILPAKME